MPVDPKYLRQHYASLSDQALLGIDRDDLVKTAQNCYDDEVRRRSLASSRGAAPPILPNKNVDVAYADVDGEASGDGDKPGWLQEAAEVFSEPDWPGKAPASDIADARDVLEAAGIPCYLDLSAIPEYKSALPKPTHLWRLMVPGNLNMRAASILDRDIFNLEFEAEWKTLLETLSDQELREMNPQLTFCGLFDRVRRVTRAYDDEIARRNR
jgi:hypothetical protein